MLRFSLAAVYMILMFLTFSNNVLSEKAKVFFFLFLLDSLYNHRTFTMLVKLN